MPGTSQKENKITDQDYTAIKFVVDRSGSMANIRTDMEGAIAAFVEEQAKQPGRCTISLSEFDTTYDDVYKSVDVNEAPSYALAPRGGTALNDAMGRAIVDFGRELKALPERQRPGKVQVIVVTDGGENSSREYSLHTIKKMVTEQTDKYNWDFVFLGANQDAVLTGTSYGFDPNKSLTWVSSSAGVTGTSSVLNEYTNTYRSTGVAAFSESDRRKATGK